MDFLFFSYGNPHSQAFKFLLYGLKIRLNGKILFFGKQRKIQVLRKTVQTVKYAQGRSSIKSSFFEKIGSRQTGKRNFLHNFAQCRECFFFIIGAICSNPLFYHKERSVLISICKLDAFGASSIQLSMALTFRFARIFCSIRISSIKKLSVRLRHRRVNPEVVIILSKIAFSGEAIKTN